MSSSIHSPAQVGDVALRVKFTAIFVVYIGTTADISRFLVILFLVLSLSFCAPQVPFSQIPDVDANVFRLGGTVGEKFDSLPVKQGFVGCLEDVWLNGDYKVGGNMTDKRQV